MADQNKTGQSKTKAAAAAPTNPDYLEARLALALVIVLQLALRGELQAGAGLFSAWMLPALETLLVVSLTSLISMRLRNLRSGRLSVPAYLERHGGAQRIMALALTGLIIAANLASLARLIWLLLHSGASGLALLADAANLWVTNVVCFAVWYWELDRGGPGRRGMASEPRPDFLFANMTAPHFCDEDWRPGFIDYLFLAFTNASAFSPTDALPLTRSAKAVMLLQAAVSLVTIAVVAARAVNILGQSS